MIIETQNLQVLFYSRPMDMRKSIGGLSIIVNDQLGLNPASGSLFVFYNRRRNKMKILYWQTNGYCLFYKRLEVDLFVIPKSEAQSFLLTYQQLRWLLEGLDISNLKGHQEKKYGLHF